MPPPTTYTYVTLAQARQELANRLYDSAQVFWSAAELNLYIQEALRTWNALTNYWRNDFTFQTQANVTWYDITNQTQMPNSSRPLTVLDTDLYDIIEYHLLEPATGAAPWTWTGSKQFSAADIVSAVQRRRDEILARVDCTITRRTVGAVAGRIYLPDTVIDVRRLAYLPNAPQLPSVVWPSDAWDEQSFNRLYTILPTAGTPFTYLMSTQPPIAFDVDKPPAYAGAYELLTIEAGPTLSPSASSLLTVPDDWTHVIKWGALSDLLSRESVAQDLPRAQYAEMRYQMGLKLLSAAAALLQMRIGNVPIQIDSIRSGDLYNTSWQGATAAQPKVVYHAGLNVLALSPQPDTSSYSMTATVVENAPVPSADGDFVQVGRDDYDSMLDYAEHLAMFKCGGAEFQGTQALLQRFLAQAQTYGLKLDELGEYSSKLFTLSQREQETNPVSAPEPSA